MGKSKDLATRVGIDDNANATAITIDSSENVGVGLTAPTAPLTIKSPTNAEAIHVVGRSDDIGQIKFLEADHTTILATIEARNSFVNFGSTANVPTKFMTNNNERMIINESGYVTMPHQPSFRAGTTSGYSSGSSVSTIQFPNVIHNVGNHYNSSNYTFTCPVAGVYYFGFHGNVRDVGGNATGSLYGEIRKNSTRVGIYYMSDDPNASWHLISGQAIVSCAANDAILVRSQSNSYWDSSDWTQFYGYLLG